MADSILRFVVAFMYSRTIFSQQKLREERDAQPFKEELEADSLRDLQSQADNLLPLRQTSVNPKKLLSLLLEYCKRPLNFINKYHLDPSNFSITLVVVQSAILLILMLYWAWSYEGLSFINLSISLQIVTIQFFFWHLNKTSDWLNFQLASFLLLILLSAEYIEFLDQQSADFQKLESNNKVCGSSLEADEVSSDTSGMKQPPFQTTRFSLFDLTNYLMIISLLAKAVCLFKFARNREANITQSQAVVNRLANVIFQEPRQGTGFAIMNLERLAKCEIGANTCQLESQKKNVGTGKRDANIKLLRINERFTELLTALEGEENNRCESMLSDCELSKMQLTRILLEDYCISKSSAAINDLFAPNAQDLTFKNQFLNALANFKPEMFESQSAPILFSQNFFHDQGSDNHSGLQQNFMNRNGLEIQVHVLCYESSMFLVKASRIALARLQMSIMQTNTVSSASYYADKNTAIINGRDNNNSGDSQVSKRFNYDYDKRLGAQRSNSDNILALNSGVLQKKATNSLTRARGDNGIQNHKSENLENVTKSSQTLQLLNNTPSHDRNRGDLPNTASIYGSIRGSERHDASIRTITNCSNENSSNNQAIAHRQTIISKQFITMRKSATLYEPSSRINKVQAQLINESEIVQREQSSWDERQNAMTDGSALLLSSEQKQSSFVQSKLSSAYNKNTNNQRVNRGSSMNSKQISSGQLKMTSQLAVHSDQQEKRKSSKYSKINDSVFTSESETLKQSSYARGKMMSNTDSQYNNINNNGNTIIEDFDPVRKLEKDRRFNSTSNKPNNNSLKQVNSQNSINTGDAITHNKQFVRQVRGQGQVRFQSQGYQQKSNSLTGAQSHHERLVRVSTSGGTEILDEVVSPNIFSELVSAGRTARSANINETIRKQQVFVYKIIHDLKHPTQAVSDGLENLIKEAEQIKHPNKNFLYKKKNQYVGHPRILLAIKLLTEFIETFCKIDTKSLRVSPMSRQKKQSKSQMNQSKVDNLSQFSNISNQNPQKQVLQRKLSMQERESDQNDAALIDQAVSPVRLSISNFQGHAHKILVQPPPQDQMQQQQQNNDHENDSFDNLPFSSDPSHNRKQQFQQNQQEQSNRRQEKHNNSLQVKEIQQAVKSVQQAFWSTPKSNLNREKLSVLSQDKEYECQQQQQQEQPQIEEEIKMVQQQNQLAQETVQQQQQQPILIQDQAFIEEVKRMPAAESLNSSSVDDKGEDMSSHHSSIADGIEEGIVEIVQKNTVELQTKDFRQSIEQQRQQSEIKSSYQFYSLAMERMLYKSNVANKLEVRDYKDIQELGKQEKQVRLNSLNNIHQVINDMVKERANQVDQNKIPNPKTDNTFEEGKSISSEVCSSKKKESEEVKNSDGPCLSQPKLNNMKSSPIFQNSPLKSKSEQKLQQRCQSCMSEIQSQSVNSPLTNSNISSAAQEKDSNDQKVIQRMTKPQLGILIHSVIKERNILIQMVESHVKKFDTIKKQLKITHGQVGSMMTFVRDLMNQAQLKNNTFSLNNDYFNCIKMVKKCMVLMTSHSLLKKIHILGPIMEKPLDKYYFEQILGDERRYQQIINNFLSNGIKFTPTHGVVSLHLQVIHVEDIHNSYILSDSDQSAPDKELIETSPQEEIKSNVTYKEKRISFQMTFRDSGCGISKEDQLKLFKNFGKLDDTQQNNKQGVGLGLSICSEIISAFGGRVEVQSQIGKGTDFIISLQTVCRIDEVRLQRAQTLLEEGGNISTSNVSDSHSNNESREEKYDTPSSGIQGSIKLHYNMSTVSEDQDQEEMSDKSVKSTGHVPYTSFNNMQKQQRKAKTQIQQHDGKPNNRPVRFDNDSKTNNHNNLIKVRQSRRNFSNRKLQTIVERTENTGKDSRIGSYLNFGDHTNQTVCLLANDQPFLLNSFELGLASHFDKIETAENGLQAIQKVRSHQKNYYSAIILDIDMPYLDGIQACIKIYQYLRDEEEKQGPNSGENNSQNISQNKKPSGDDSTVGGPSNKMRSKATFSSGYTRAIPYVYALTSEIDETIVKKMQNAGFKAIYHVLDQPTIKAIKENAGLEYHEPVGSEENYEQRSASLYEGDGELDDNDNENESSVSIVSDQVQQDEQLQNDGAQQQSNSNDSRRSQQSQQVQVLSSELKKLFEEEKKQQNSQPEQARTEQLMESSSSPEPSTVSQQALEN